MISARFIVSMFCVFTMLVSGCATVFRGGSEDITISTVPSGATVQLSNGMTCTSPCQLEVSRKHDLMVTVTKDGYKELNTAMPTTIDGASVGVGTFANLLFLPIINDIVDYNTRANYSHKPNPLHIRLIEETSDREYQLVAPPAAVKGKAASGDDEEAQEKGEAEGGRADESAAYEGVTTKQEVGRELGDIEYRLRTLEERNRQLEQQLERSPKADDETTQNQRHRRRGLNR